jgi:transposase
MLDEAHNHCTPTIYAAIELSKKSWVVAIMQPAKDQPSVHRIKGGAFSDLIAKLQAAAPGGERLLVCYEAGYDGFWLARSLKAEGIECHVLDPASLQVNRRARRVKTDRIDVPMLVRALLAIDRGDRHVCSIVRAPSVEEEDARRSHRERQRLIRERTAHINRIKGLLFGQGIRGVEPGLRRTRSIFPPCAPAKNCRFPIVCALNSSVNMPVSTSWKSNYARWKPNETQRMRKILPSNASATCSFNCVASARRAQQFSPARFSDAVSPTGDN